MNVWLQVLLTALISVLILLVEHWAPVEEIAQKKLHQTVNYVQGVAALLIPLSGLFLLWGRLEEIAALWVVAGLGGLGVISAYWLDGWLNARKRMRIAEKEAKTLRPSTEPRDDERP